VWARGWLGVGALLQAIGEKGRSTPPGGSSDQNSAEGCRGNFKLARALIGLWEEGCGAVKAATFG
jgi:hypothetical protein